MFKAGWTENNNKWVGLAAPKV